MRESEQRKKLTDYLEKNLKKGYTEDSLKWALINQGYSRVLVEIAVKEAHLELAKKAPLLEDKPKISYDVIDEFNNPIQIKTPWWKKIFGI